MEQMIFADGMVTPMQMDAIVQWLMTFHNAYPIVGILMLLMAFDVCVGICAAFVTKTLSSTISQNGMVRKVLNLLLIGVGAVLEPYAGGIPLSKMVAMAFIVTELISITENSARAGVPVPQPLMDVLQRLRNNEKASVQSQQPATSTVNIQRASNVDIRTPDGSIHSDNGDTHSRDSAVIIKTSEKDV